MDKKILVIINNLGIGGAERLVIDDINEMVARGLNVWLLTLKKEKQSLEGDLVLEKSRRIQVPFSSLFDVKSWFVVFKEIRKLKPDVVFTHLWFANTIGRITAWIAGVRTIIAFEHGLYDSSRNRKIFLVDRVLQYLSNPIISVSTSFKRELVNRGIQEKRSRLFSMQLNLINIVMLHLLP